MSRFYEWSDKGKGGMKGREGRRGGGQREGGGGWVGTSSLFITQDSTASKNVFFTFEMSGSRFLFLIRISRLSSDVYKKTNESHQFGS